MNKISEKDIGIFELGSCILVGSKHTTIVGGRESVVKASKSRGNIKGITVDNNGVVTIKLEWIMTKQGLWGHWKFERNQNIVFKLEPCSWEWEIEDLVIHCNHMTAKLMRYRIPLPSESAE